MPRLLLRGAARPPVVAADATRVQRAIHAVAEPRLIESGRFQFYVQEQGQRVAVRVIAPKNARKYLRTVADRKDPNNLELLTVCKGP